LGAITISIPVFNLFATVLREVLMQFFKEN